MRILEVAPFAAPIDEARTELGGAQIMLQEIARGLAARGHEVRLAAARGSRVEGVDVLPLGIDSARMRKADLGKSAGPREDDPEQRAAFGRVREWIEDHADAVDVIHAHAYDAPAFEALSGAPRPVVHTLHLPPLDRDVVRAARIAKGATMVTVSHANAAAWRDAGVPVTQVVANGIEVTNIPLGRDHREHLLYAGRISPEKGVIDALDVAERSRRGILLVGQIYDEAYFAKVVAPRVRAVPEALPLRAPVRGAIFIGPRPRAQVHELMSRAAATVMAVRWDEPFGLVALESLAAGTPVIGYRRGGLAEIVDQRVGALVDPDDVHALALAADRVGRIDPAECRRRAQRFSVDAMVAAYETLLAGVVHSDA